MFTEDIYNLAIPRWSHFATTSLTSDMSKTNAAVAIPDGIVISKIFIVRGKKVMVDTDLAELYGVTTKRLNEQVKRNVKRFPEDFMFQLSKDEKQRLTESHAHLNS